MYDLLFYVVAVVAPKMMHTPGSKMAQMVAFDEDSPKQRTPFTVSYKSRNIALQMLPGLFIQDSRNNSDII